MARRLDDKTFDNVVRMAFLAGMAHGWRSAGNTHFDAIPLVNTKLAMRDTFNMLAMPHPLENCVLCGVERGQLHARGECPGEAVFVFDYSAEEYTSGR